MDVKIMFVTDHEISQEQADVWALEMLLEINRRKIEALVRERPDLKPLVDVVLESI